MWVCIKNRLTTICIERPFGSLHVLDFTATEPQMPSLTDPTEVAHAVPMPLTIRDLRICVRIWPLVVATRDRRTTHDDFANRTDW